MKLSTHIALRIDEMTNKRIYTNGLLYTYIVIRMLKQPSLGSLFKYK